MLSVCMRNWISRGISGEFIVHSPSECGKWCKESVNDSLDRLLYSEKLIRPLSSVYDEFTLSVNVYFLNAFGKTLNLR